MIKVVTVNLNDRAYQFEEPGESKLRAYLRQAEKKLANDPERAEVLKDFEQAIADKCAQYLKDGKDVVTVDEVEQIIKDMGPVEAAEENAPSAAQPATKRLYLIREGSVLGGVCTGLGAYFNVDVNVVRLLFIILTIITSGLGIVIYLLMMFFLPEAETPEEKASAHGEPYSANDLLERARAKYAELRGSDHWREAAKSVEANGEHLRETGKDVTEQISKYVTQTTRQALHNSQPAFTNVGQGIGRLARLVVRCWMAILAIIMATLGITWFVTLWSIAVSNRIWGYTLDPHFSRWLFGLWDSSIFLVAVLPFLMLWLLALHVLHKEMNRSRRILNYVTGIGWCVAIAATIAIPLCSTQLRDVSNWNEKKSGTLDFGARKTCYTKTAHNDYTFRDCTQ